MSTPSVTLPPPPTFRQSLASSTRFWEPRRIAYNLVLFAVCTIWFLASWPHFRPALHLSTLLPMLFLAVIANLCYSTAYLVDIPLLNSRLRSAWLSRRWILWVVGTLFAILLTNYWIADEIYPFVQ